MFDYLNRTSPIDYRSLRKNRDSTLQIRDLIFTLMFSNEIAKIFIVIFFSSHEKVLLSSDELKTKSLDNQLYSIITQCSIVAEIVR